jgi:hypothetical protein
MQADIFHGANFSVYVGDADHLAAAGEFLDFVEGGEFGLCGEFGESHRFSGTAEKRGPSFARQTV